MVDLLKRKSNIEFTLAYINHSKMKSKYPETLVMMDNTLEWLYLVNVTATIYLYYCFTTITPQNIIKC